MVHVVSCTKINKGMEYCVKDKENTLKLEYVHRETCSTFGIKRRGFPSFGGLQECTSVMPELMEHQQRTYLGLKLQGQARQNQIPARCRREQQPRASPKPEQRASEQAALVQAGREVPEEALSHSSLPHFSSMCRLSSQLHNRKDTGNFLQVHFYLK